MAVLTQPRSRRLVRPHGLAWRRALWGYLFISPWIIGFLVFTLGPVIATLGFTFTNINLEQAKPLQFVGLRNYEKLLNDQTAIHSLSVTFRYALSPRMSLKEKVAHYFGASVPICVPWWFATWAGAVLGTAIPAGLALDFAVPITFIALFAPTLRTVPHIAAAAVSVVVALALSWLPWNLWLMVAAGAAMLTGALVEAWRERRA